MDKTIFVTGSSRGIGKAIALYLAENGYNIVLHCNKNIEMLKDVQKIIEQKGVQVRILQFDIKNRKECNEKIAEDINKNGVYYGVVLNAGIAKDSPFPAMEDDFWDSVIDTNLGGFYNVLKPIVMPMIQNRLGRIITMSSISGLTGNRGQVNYSASKAGIIGATKALSRELAKRKITVNCVAPGIIDTDMISDIPENIINELVPMKRSGTTKEVASLINYLMSEDAAYITGQVISVNGGMYL
ncbi:3-oxoacyl-ACP reductase FabG [bacterium]|nr:3-oxoacyl-ACP reductase FabG [bacterium]